jgi:thiol-disulfide isomerase/thioredoxin
MSFNKLMRATIKDIQAYSEGGNMVPKTHGFTLKEVRTGKAFTLEEGKGKVRAFMFGSISNPPARAQLPLWDRLLAKYDTAQVELFVVYGRELHPGDKKSFRKYPAPSTMEQKLAYAREFAGLTALPVLVDGMDDKVFTTYGRVPNGAFVVDADGKLIFRGTWADSRKIEQILDTVLKWYADGRPKLPAVR